MLAFWTDYQGNILDTAARPLSSFQADPRPASAMALADEVWDFGTAQQVTVHVGPYPKDERRNGFIWPATAFELQKLPGVIPPGTPDMDALAWQQVGIYPHSPALVVIGHAAVVTFRARYLDHLNNVGPWGPPESCSVTA